MSVSSPVRVRVEAGGVAFAESVHAADFRMAERREEFHKLLLVQRGQVTLRWRNGRSQGRSEGRRGTLWVVPAGASHWLIDTEPSVLLLLCVGRGLAEKDRRVRPLWQRLETESPSTHTLGTFAAGLENHWRRALHEQLRDEIGGAAIPYALALQMLVTIVRLDRQNGEGSAAERVRQVRRQIEQTLYERWSIEEAAAAANLSRRQFTKLFRLETGRSFVEFLSRGRIEYVESLLVSKRHTVTGAAFSAGFEDLSHFYRLFGKKHGLPPGAWLKKHKIE